MERGRRTAAGRAKTSFHVLHELEHLLDMARNLDAPPLAAHDAPRIDRESAALDAAYLSAIHVFHLDDAVELAHGLVGVGKELEGEFHLGLEAFVRLQAVARYAVNRASRFLEVGIEVAELLALGGATRRIVFGIKIEDEGSTLGAGQAERLAAGCGQLEIGRWLI